MNVASRSSVEECIGVIKTRLDNRRGDSGGHGVSECRSDVSESTGMEENVAKIKMATSFLTKRSGTQFYHDWKPLRSIIGILYKISRRTIQIQGDFQDFQEL